MAVPPLSVADSGAKLTRAPAPLAVQVARAVLPGGGQLVKVGFSASSTVTVWVQEALLPPAPTAVQVIVVVPRGKRLPAGIPLALIVTPGQLSVAEAVPSAALLTRAVL